MRAPVLIVAIIAACGGKRPAPGHDAGRAAAEESAPAARPLADAGAALAAVTLAGHTIDIVRRGPDFGAIVSGSGVAATVTISACVACVPIDAARWQAERPALMAVLAPAPGDSLSIDRVERGGRSLILIRARRTIEGAAHAIAQAHWNDGSTQLAASCEATDGDACARLVEAAATAYLAALAP